MIKKKIFYLLFFLICICPQTDVCAQDNCVMFWLNDGQQILYMLDKHPKIHYSNDDVVLTTDDLKIEYPIGNLNMVTFENDSIVNQIENINGKPMEYINMEKNYISFDGFSPNSIVSLYCINGSQIESYKINNQGSLFINIDEHPKGIYIIKINNTSIKVLKK